MKRAFGLWLLLVLVACQGVTGPDNKAAQPPEMLAPGCPKLITEEDLHPIPLIEGEFLPTQLGVERAAGGPGVWLYALPPELRGAGGTIRMTLMNVPPKGVIYLELSGSLHGGHGIAGNDGYSSLHDPLPKRITVEGTMLENETWWAEVRYLPDYRDFTCPRMRIRFDRVAP